MLPRSKSAPKFLDDLTTDGGPNAPRLPRSRTAQTALSSLRVAPWRNDPFSLNRFFPSGLTEQQAEWDWLHAREPALDGDDEEDIDDGDRDDDLSSYGDIFGSAKNERREAEDFDALVRQVIDGEDKYGMLAFSSENIQNLLSFKLPMFGRPTSPEHVSMLNVDEPADLDGLHVRHCVRRRDTVGEPLLETDSGTGSDIGELFFAKDVVAAIKFPFWMNVLYRWVGGGERG